MVSQWAHNPQFRFDSVTRNHYGDGILSLHDLELLKEVVCVSLEPFLFALEHLYSQTCKPFESVKLLSNLQKPFGLLLIDLV